MSPGGNGWLGIPFIGFSHRGVVVGGGPVNDAQPGIGPADACWRKPSAFDAELSYGRGALCKGCNGSILGSGGNFGTKGLLVAVKAFVGWSYDGATF